MLSRPHGEDYIRVGINVEFEVRATVVIERVLSMCQAPRESWQAWHQ